MTTFESTKSMRYHISVYTVAVNVFAQSITLSRKKIIFYTCGDQKKQVNAAYLIGSYAVSGAQMHVIYIPCNTRGTC